MATDTERLDWLESFPASLYELTGGGWQVWSEVNFDREADDYPTKATAREAIDAAMAQEAGEDV